MHSCIDNKIVASRQQIPVVLAYGMTIHKAQGLTIDRVIVDCSNIFKAGQLGVAIGRAKKKKGLQLLNFEPKVVITPTETIFDFYKLQSLPLCEDVRDCCQISLAITEELCKDIAADDDIQEVNKEKDDTDTEMSEFSADELEQIDCITMLSEDIMEEEENIVADIEERTDSEIQDCNVNVTLEDLKSCVPEQCVTIEQNIIRDKLNYLITHQANSMNVYLRKRYLKLSDLCKSHCVVAEKINTDSKIWTKYDTEVYKFSNSEEYCGFTKGCIKRKPDETDYTVFSRIFDHVSLCVLRKTNEQSTCHHENQRGPDHNPAISEAALGKLRYIGGRCVAKSKYHFMKMGRANLYKKTKTKFVCQCF